MSPRGEISKRPSRTLTYMIAGHATWVALLCGIGFWWGWLLFKKAERIHELELQLNYSAEEIAKEWASTQRMIFWEGTTYFALVLLVTFFLLWFYLRELKRSRGLQAFFASLTHELRTPLTSIRLQAESLAEVVGESPSGRKLVRRLLEDTSRLETQVERTLELSRVESGGLLVTEQLNLSQLLETVLDQQRELFSDRIDVKLIGQETEALVEADRNAVTVIVRNLIENTIRHGGKNRLSIQFTIEPESSRGFRPLLVSDNGVGVADLASVGKLFSKGEKSQGAGVGLYLVKALVERMRGVTSFVKREDPGFCIRIEFKAVKSRG